MALATGARIGPYEIIAPLGAGGMGEVYRAHDTTLGRHVALKVLSSSLSIDSDHLARFEREARLLAALNHPNIATIYGIETSGTVTALVLELIDGDTLADRLERGPMALTEALGVAVQIADALDAAHEKGIVHRDLKPANIKVTPAGRVKVLDFGLAKAVTPDESADRSQSPTMTVDATRHGIVLGTAAYMSPEQARGFPVDRRTDIWAFGCVLYEMLTGRAPFARGTVSDTIAALLERDPDWDALPPATPPHIVRLLRRCLDKSASHRLRDIGDARADLEDPPPMPSIGAAAVEAKGTSRRWLWTAIGAALLAGLAVGWFATTRLQRRVTERNSGPRLTRVTWDSSLAAEPALSPDGTLVAYSSNAGNPSNMDLWLERVGSDRPVELTHDASDDREPTFSPDGTLLAFRSDRNGGGIYVMPALGGDARLVADSGRRPRFSPDGTRIAYWTGPSLGGTRGPSAIFVVAKNGGAPTPIASGFANARDPVWSPDGRGLLFFGRRAAAPTREYFAAAGGRAGDDSEWDWWWTAAGDGEPVPTGVYPSLMKMGVTFAPGWGDEALPSAWTADGVLFAATIDQATNLWRVPVSPVSGRIDGPFVRLTTGVGSLRQPTADSSGRIAFQLASTADAVFSLDLDPLTGQSRQTIQRLVSDATTLDAHRGSANADGSLLVYPKHRPTLSELWLKDLRTGAARHLVTTAPSSLNPVISADGSRVGYTVVEKNQSNGFMIPSGGGGVKKICERCQLYDWLDNRRIFIRPSTEPTVVRLLDTMSGGTEDVFHADAQIGRVDPSRDGRWVAVSVANRVFVVRVRAGLVSTSATLAPVQLPAAAQPGRECGWSPDGRLLYVLLWTDGFRCLYALRFDPDRGVAIGEAFAVHHFHDPQRVWGSTPFNNAVTDHTFIFDQNETVGSIWLMDNAAK